MAGEPKTLSAYQAFFRETFNELKQKALGAGGGDAKCPTNTIVAEVGKRWRALTDEQKAQYAGSSELVKVKDKKRKRKTKAEKEEKKKKKAERPKRALTGYQVFFKENAAKLKSECENQKEVVQKIGEKWQALGDAGKEKYKQKAAKESAVAEA